MMMMMLYWHWTRGTTNLQYNHPSMSRLRWTIWGSSLVFSFYIFIVPTCKTFQGTHMHHQSFQKRQISWYRWSFCFETFWRRKLIHKSTKEWRFTTNWSADSNCQTFIHITEMHQSELWCQFPITAFNSVDLLKPKFFPIIIAPQE